MTEKRPVASILRELRQKRGISLRRAAEDLGIAPSHLSRLERGEKVASADLAARAARYYGTDSDIVALEQGRVPEDILQILRNNPGLLASLRAEFGQTSEET